MQDSHASDGKDRKARLDRLFALNRQALNVAAAESAPFVPERVVSPGFARHFQDAASRSLRDKPRA